MTSFGLTSLPSPGPALLLAWPCLYLTMVLHEAGHAAAHLALGGCIRELHFGGTWWRVARRLRLGLLPWTGRVVYEEQPRLTRAQRAVVTMAGPGVNLLAGFALLALAGDQLWSFELAGVNLLCGALNLLPVLSFDGRRLLSLWMSHRQYSPQRRAAVTRRVEASTFWALALTAFVLALRTALG